MMYSLVSLFAFYELTISSRLLQQYQFEAAETATTPRADEYSCDTVSSVSVDYDVKYTPSDYPEDLLMDIYYPSDYDISEKLPCSIFVHGGLWQAGNQKSGAVYSQNVVKATRTIVASIQYRLTKSGVCCGSNECSGSSPDFVYDAVAALNYLEKYEKCDASKFFCFGHSAGGQICTQIGIQYQSKRLKLNPNIEYKGYVGIEGIYNLTKFYAGPKGENFQCAVEKAFGSNSLLWCGTGDNSCDPIVANGEYSGPKSLFIHSPEDKLVLAQQAKEIVCRLNGVKESECSCFGYNDCQCLDECINNNNEYATFTDKVTGDHFSVLSSDGLVKATRDFICPIIES